MAWEDILKLTRENLEINKQFLKDCEAYVETHWEDSEGEVGINPRTKSFVHNQDKIQNILETQLIPLIKEAIKLEEENLKR